LEAKQRLEIFFTELKAELADKIKQTPSSNNDFKFIRQARRNLARLHNISKASYSVLSDIEPLKSSRKFD
jgi:ribosomal protein L29